MILPRRAATAISRNAKRPRDRTANRGLPSWRQAGLSVAMLVLLTGGAADPSTTGIANVVAAGVEPQLVQGDFLLTEGPVGAADGSLYFSERGKPTRTYHLGLDGKITTVRENTNTANGLAFTPDGSMVLVEGAGKRVSRIENDGALTTLTEQFQGKPFMEPNDLIVDAKGGIYFTDPGPRPLVPERPTYIFYLPRGAHDPLVMDSSNPRPNGVILSPDGRTLYVDNTLGPIIDAYDVGPDGRLTNKRNFAQLRDIPTGQESGADGMAVDQSGRLYVSSIRGIQVFDRKGRYRGAIALPAQPVNMAFAGADKRTLYVTARQNLYSIRMLARGPKRLGK